MMSKIEDFEFEGCVLKKYNGSDTIVEIPEGVAHIGDEAFYYCDTITQVIFPNSVKSIGEYAFWGCESIEKITLPKSVMSIGIGAFSECSSLFKITIPDSVAKIDKYTFSGCCSLNKMKIPNGVSEIGCAAFFSCDALRDIVIPKSVKTIGDNAFRYCESLREVVIVDGVVNIGKYAFSDCESLRRITIPSSVEKIGEFALCRCPNLSVVTAYGDNFFGIRIFGLKIKRKFSLITPNKNFYSLSKGLIPFAIYGFVTEGSKDVEYDREVLIDYFKEMEKNAEAYFDDSRESFIETITEKKLIPYDMIETLVEITDSATIRAILLEYKKKFTKEEIDECKKKEEQDFLDDIGLNDDEEE